MLECAARTKTIMSYEEALLYCAFCNCNGHSDWRMPTHAEFCQYKMVGGWFLGRESIFDWTVMPVRDI